MLPIPKFPPSRTPTDPADEIWLKRYHALWQTLVAYEAWLVDQKLNLPLVLGAVQNLRAFFELQFDFFYNGSGGMTKTGHHLLASDYYPWDYVHNVVLDQVASDLSELQEAAAQRIPVFVKLNGNPAIPDRLVQADELACLALAPAIAARFFGEQPPAVLTYFQKYPSIRVMPYANLALIGIPYSCLEVQRDLLSIPHEIGHYLYWHGRKPGDSSPMHAAVKAALSGNPFPKYFSRWAEEIFADVYGCKVAGPLFAWTGQILKRQFSLDQFLTDDAEHPAPVVRPYVYHTALQGISNSVLLDKLKTHWRDYRAGRDAVADVVAATNTEDLRSGHFKLHDSGWQPTADVIDVPDPATGLTKVGQAVENIRTHLPPMPSFPAAWMSRWQATAKDLFPEPEVHALYDEIASLHLNPEAEDVQLGCAHTINTFDPAIWWTKLEALCSATAEKTLPAEVWFELLKFAGWATKINGDARG